MASFRIIDVPSGERVWAYLARPDGADKPAYSTEMRSAVEAAVSTYAVSVCHAFAPSACGTDHAAAAERAEGATCGLLYAHPGGGE